MFEFINRFWIAVPLSYAITVGGLVNGYRHGGVSSDASIPRALLAGLAVLPALIIAWSCINEIVEAGIQPAPLLGLHTVLFFVFLLSASALAGSVLARRKPGTLIERGTIVLDDSPPETSTEPGTLTLAGHPIPLGDETKHFKIIGTTGAGKSTAIRELLTGALGRGDRAVIADPDGDYLQRFYDPGRGDIILNPFDARSARWDLFAEITVPQDADQLARSVIPDYDGKDHIWTGFARTYVSSILRQLHRVEEHNLAKLYHLLVQAPETELRDLLQGTPAARFIGKEGGKFLESVQSVTNHHLGVIEDVARQSEDNLLSIRRWIREGRGVLFLPTAPTKSHHYRSSSVHGCASPSSKPSAARWATRESGSSSTSSARLAPLMA